MEYRRVGQTSLRVSQFCLGAMTFGTQYYNIGAVEQPLANEMVQTALDAGVNFFDTADVYSYGASERILGEALRQADASRDEVVLATKVGSPTDPAIREGGFNGANVNKRGLSRKHINEACRDSLKRLQTDYIDLYQVHKWDPDAPVEETLRSLTDLVRAGTVRYIGCSNWSVRHLSRALTLSEHLPLERFVSLQPYYSLVGRDLEHELLPLCREQGLAVFPWSPLAGGFLTGKYRREGSKEGRRVDFDFPPLDEETGFEVVEACEAVARENDATIPQVALSWLVGRPGVTSVILGARTLEQLEENLASTDVTLSEDQRERLSSISEPEPIYPGWMVQFAVDNAPGEPGD